MDIIYPLTLLGVVAVIGVVLAAVAWQRHVAGLSFSDELHDAAGRDRLTADRRRGPRWSVPSAA